MPKYRHTRSLVVAVAALAAVPAAATAAEVDARGTAFFEARIRPVLIQHCYECHSGTGAKVKGGLWLDTRDGVRNGGDSGAAVVPGNPDGSLLIKAIRHETVNKMPPKSRLPDNVVADFVEWIRMGAPDPRDGNAPTYKRISIEKAREHWAYGAARKPAVPEVKNAAWPAGDVDRFILAELEKSGAAPVADADRPTIARRLYSDLLGLPPQVEELDAFLRDDSPQAYEKLVDRLLASPHFGERWGRHWLDVARFAESNGNADNVPFPFAWRYRDYVIAAFNKDKPYNRFITEQVAGDLLNAADPAERDELLIATGFLALTSKPRAQNNPDFRMDLVADQIDVTSRAVLGLSMLCARCHDHKFDPISTKEYYGLAGIFDSSVMLTGTQVKAQVKKANAGINGTHTLSDGSPAMGVAEGKAADCAVCIRGDSTKRGETVTRGFPTVATLGKAPTIDRSKSGRLELAAWLTTPDNPLTARVAVNRVWQHLFGRGLVKTSDNFGALGEAPSHPALLDYLAVRFIEDGWSHKKLIRALVLSRTYRLDSRFDAALYRSDPDNVRLWRSNQRRLDAEAIRDGILAVSGRLERTPPTGSAAGPVGKQATKNRAGPKEINNRSVYLGIVRGAPLPELLAVFDVANPNIVVAQREVTTVPAQALYLINSPWVAEQAGHTADRLLGDAKLDDEGRVDRAYKLTLSRLPNESERRRALEYVRAVSGGKTGPPARAGWAGFVQALFASAEFRYVD
jgi:hypothetical protein